ncbi:hypothetical protein JL475_24340 [Streptomyces sp. M2CJ-2]|uniref:hypothetical protein n=1 Tax=Streptomyces sp. M2CJ-2 TaxID=2803948 RepID=UPI001927C0CE|nr:hypothetical protein [Streptomyces sp. M2CJ-2]MBL3669065.1 hypothetical protein [Streptomyces sp. M2CJ-2]
MRTRTALAAALLALAALTAGCSNDSSDDKPAAATTAPQPPAATIDPAEARQACVDAWADTISDRPADFDPEADSDTEPAECEGLPEDEWTDRYMEGLEQSNQAGRDALQDLIDEAETAQP